MRNTLRLAAVFSDHMVLCREKNIRVFGEAQDGAVITAELNGHKAEAASYRGRFQAVLPAMQAGGPYSLTVTDGEETVALTDVMIGDVYLAGGQSNMEMPLEQSEGGAELAETLDNPMIRWCTFPKNALSDQRAIFYEQRMRWNVLKPKASRQCSAAACHFALELQREIGVAVGIIVCCWGGSSAACWLDEDALMETTAGQTLLTAYQARTANKTDAEYDLEMQLYNAEYQAWWKRVKQMQTDDPAVSWAVINETAGRIPWPQPEGRKSPYRPGGLAETMLKRIAPYTLTGILFYQGEEDAKHPHLYRLLLETLIGFWRRLFLDLRLPFLFVQLPMYAEKGREDDTSWAMIRQAQDQVYLQMRNTGMAVMIDGGEFDTLHPRDKKTVGHRLYLQAMQTVYDQDIQGDSPRALSARREGKSVCVCLSAEVKADGEARLFELAGADGVFHPAAAQISGIECRLQADGVDQAEHVRYAFVNYGHVNVFGAENGLPLAPFLLDLQSGCMHNEGLE